MIAPCAARDAGLVRRLAALALDLSVIGALFAFGWLLAHKSGLAALWWPGPAGGVSAVWSRPQIGLGAGIAVAIATVFAWRYLAGTPGALLMGITVCRARDGARPGLLRASLRLAAAVALGGLGLALCVGGRRAAHDRLSGTRAVLEDEAEACLAHFARWQR